MSDFGVERLRDYAGRWIPLSAIDDGVPVIGEHRLALMALRACDEIERLREELANERLLLAAIVEQSGGEVRVFRKTVEQLRGFHLLRSTCEATRSIVVTIFNDADAEGGE